VKIKKITPELSPYFHIFLYGLPGCGKDKFAGDFHLRGQDMVLVTSEEGDLTLRTMGITCPRLIPENTDEVQAIIEKPEDVVRNVINVQPGFENYVPKTWAFQNLRKIQNTLFGEGPRKETQVMGGTVTLEKREATGIMSEPNRRDSPEVPSNKDYRMLDARMRGVVALIEKMPYHTIVTTHAEIDLSKASRAEIITRDSQTKEGRAKLNEANVEMEGWPSLDGFSLKYDLPGLVGDFYIFLEGDGKNFYMYPKPYKKFYARTRVAPFMPSSLDWTNKNAYDEIMARYKMALSKGK